MKQNVEPEPLLPPPPPVPRPGAPVTRTIVALNVAVFIAQVVLARSAAAIGHVPEVESLQFGANYAIATIHEHRLETLVTACFLHAGIVHLGLNMLVLWQAGPIVERAVGAARMAPMYLFAGIVSSALSTLVMWMRGTGGFGVGASGAIMGVLAAAMVLGWRIQGWRGPLTQSMVRWLGFNLVFGILIGMQGGNIDNAAHIGGAIAGALVAILWRRGVSYSPATTRLVVAACAALVVGAAGAVVARDAMDKYAAIPVQQRFDIAREELDQGHCREASGALRATERLMPNHPRVRQLRADYDAFCGRPM